MNETKAKAGFTPGPWKVDGDFIRDHNDDWLIAKVGWPDDGETGEANARLIAAAPAMYEALKALVQVFGNAPILETDSKLPGSYNAWKAGVNALAQAEGQS